MEGQRGKAKERPRRVTYIGFGSDGDGKRRKGEGRRGFPSQLSTSGKQTAFCSCKNSNKCAFITQLCFLQLSAAYIRALGNHGAKWLFLMGNIWCLPPDNAAIIWQDISETFIYSVGLHTVFQQCSLLFFYWVISYTHLSDTEFWNRIFWYCLVLIFFPSLLWFVQKGCCLISQSL